MRLYQIGLLGGIVMMPDVRDLEIIEHGEIHLQQSIESGCKLP